MQPGHDSNNQVPGSLKNAIQVLAHFFLMILLISPLNRWRSWCYMICQETQAAADRVGMGDQVYAGLLGHKFRGLLHLHAGAAMTFKGVPPNRFTSALKPSLSLCTFSWIRSPLLRAWAGLPTPDPPSLEPSWPAGFSWRAERSPAPRGPKPGNSGPYDLADHLLSNPSPSPPAVLTERDPALVNSFIAQDCSEPRSLPP